MYAVCFVCCSAMAEHSPSSSGVTDSDRVIELTPSLEGDFVKIPKTQFQQAIVKMRQQERQLVATSNLHRLMREKEEELAASKEQLRQTQASLQQSDTRLSTVLRLQAAVTATSPPTSTHSLEEDGAFPVCAGESLIPHSEGSVFLKSSDVEADGEPLMTLQPGNVLVGKDPEKSMNKQLMTSDISISASVPSPSLLVTLSSASVTSASTDTCSSRVTCLASSVTASQLPLSSVTSSSNLVSKDLLDKVLQQNARLKKTLRDLLSQKGLSVSTYLVCYYVIVF